MPDLSLDGRVAAITGAGRGLGRAYAELLAARGARVVVNNRIRPGTGDQRPVAEEAVAAIRAAGGEATANTADIGTQAGAESVVQSALDAFGQIDIVVNNAGIVHFHKFDAYPDDEFAEMLDIQLRAAWFINKAAWPHLAAQGYGRIINTVSRGAFFGDPQGAAYAASKGAIYGLTRALAVEGRPLGILVNAISPTAWTPLYARAPDVSAERRAMMQERFTTDLVAPVVLALAHDSLEVTGEIFGAAGGHVSRMFMAQTAGIQVQEGFTATEFYDRLPEIWSEIGSQPMGLVDPSERQQGTPVTVAPPQAQPRSRD